ncbi:hypothetical protein J7438_26880, partial [Thalassotalea sp. G20_0]|uniref:hypothetical protein n=1 Tax=Thalassotalea sp. G20_0 TaxID=2821093 RepID=UPI001AD992A1
MPVDADVIDEEAAELSLEPGITVCLAVPGGADCFDCLACAAVDPSVEVGEAVVLSDIPELPSAV